MESLEEFGGSEHSLGWFPVDAHGRSQVLLTVHPSPVVLFGRTPGRTTLSQTARHLNYYV
jgi:hypothetical protein